MTNANNAAVANSAQARATRQSAIINLMGAGSARAQTSEGSKGFADALNSATDMKDPGGLFSDKPVEFPEARKSVNHRNSGSRRDSESDSSNSAPAVREKRSPATDPDTKAAEQSLDLDSHSPLNSASVNSTSGQSTVDPINQATQTASQANTPEADAMGDDLPVNGKTRVSGASDPLRLITPQNVPNADGQNNGTDVNGQPNSPAQYGTNNAAAAAASNGTPNSNGSANPKNPVQSTMTVAATNGISPAQTPQTAPGTQSPGSPTANGGVPSGTTKPVGIDPNISPFRIGGGRLDTPITLKLRANPNPVSAESLSQNDADSIGKVMGRSLSTALSQKTPLVTLWMTPETLGKVKISLTFDQGTISAKFEATSEATRNLLEQNSGALREALESRGLRADKIEVVSVPDWTQTSGSTGTTPKATATDTSGNSPNYDQSGNGQPGNGQTGNGQPGNGQPGTGQPNSGTTSTGEPTSNNGTNSPEVPSHISHGTLPGGARVELQMDSRLVMLNARLELDAVA